MIHPKPVVLVILSLHHLTPLNQMMVMLLPAATSPSKLMLGYCLPGLDRSSFCKWRDFIHFGCCTQLSFQCIACCWAVGHCNHIPAHNELPPQLYSWWFHWFVLPFCEINNLCSCAVGQFQVEVGWQSTQCYSNGTGCCNNKFVIVNISSGWSIQWC